MRPACAPSRRSCARSPRDVEPAAPGGYLLPAMNVIPQRVRDGVGRALDPGWIRWAGFLLLFSGLFDMVDGRVARSGAMATTFGAFYDSTLDRVGEAALFTGIAVYFLGGGVAAGRLTAAVVACCVALAASL